MLINCQLSWWSKLDWRLPHFLTCATAWWPQGHCSDPYTHWSGPLSSADTVACVPAALCQTFPHRGCPGVLMLFWLAASSLCTEMNICFYTVCFTWEWGWLVEFLTNHHTFEKTSAGSSPLNSDSRATGTGTAPAVKCIASFCLAFLAACKIQCSKSVKVLRQECYLKHILLQLVNKYLNQLWFHKPFQAY